MKLITTKRKMMIIIVIIQFYHCLKLVVAHDLLTRNNTRRSDKSSFSGERKGANKTFVFK